MTQPKDAGSQAESYFESILAKKNVMFERRVTIDYFINGIIPVEVKSCSLLKNKGNPDVAQLKYGNFQLNQEQHDSVLKENGWYCFLITYDDQSLLVGFLKANTLKRLTYSIREIALLKPVSLKEFTQQLGMSMGGQQ